MWYNVYRKKRRDNMGYRAIYEARIKEEEKKVQEVLENTDDFELLREHDIELDILVTEQKIQTLEQKLARLKQARNK